MGVGRDFSYLTKTIQQKEFSNGISLPRQMTVLLVFDVSLMYVPLQYSLPSPTPVFNDLFCFFVLHGVILGWHQSFPHV